MSNNQFRKLFSIRPIALSVLLGSGQLMAAQDPAPTSAELSAPKPSRVTRDELKDKQLDVSLETRDIERVLGKLKKASELAKQRITEAAVTTESVTTSLNKGDAITARSDAKQATEKFKEIVKQLEALLKEEAPQQIAEAKQLARELAKLEREFADKFEGALNPVQVTTSGKSKIDPKSQVPPMTSDEIKGQGASGKGKSKGTQEGKPADDATETEKTSSPDPQTKGSKPAERSSQDGNEADAGAKPKEPGDSGGTEKKDPADTKSSGGSGDDGDLDNSDDGSSSKRSKNDGQTSTDGTSTNEPTGKPDEQGNNGNSSQSPKGRRGGNNGDSNKDQTTDDNTKLGTGMSAEQLREAVARRAEKLAQTGRTLQDVLNAVARSDNPADKEAAGRIQSILKEVDIQRLIDQMDGVGNMIRSRKDIDAKMSSIDLAERFEIMAQRLEAAYLSIVAPQAEELRKLEAKLVELQERLDQLETPNQVALWHREVRELLDQLDQLGIQATARDQLEAEMKKGGFGIDRDPIRRNLDWSLVNDRYLPPAGYLAPLSLLQEEVQARIQSLVLGDLGNLSDDSTPPMYQELVDRYYQVLSGEQGRRKEAPSPNKSMKSPHPGNLKK